MFAAEVYEDHYEVRLEEQNPLKRKGNLCEKARETKESWCAFLSEEDCCGKKRACDGKRKKMEV